MSRILHIPTGIVFFCPDIFYFEELFKADPTLFYNTGTKSQSVTYMTRLIDLIDEADEKHIFFIAPTYPESVRELQFWGRETFEVLDVS